MPKNNSIRQILRALAPHAILVGSASRGDNYQDIDLVINERGLRTARSVLPGPLVSCYLGHLKTFQTQPPVEVMRYWQGPLYGELAHRRLVIREVSGVKLRAWPGETRQDEQSCSQSGAASRQRGERLRR
jgi:hypothetical protein